MISTVATIYLAGSRYIEEPHCSWKSKFVDLLEKHSPGDFEFVNPIPDIKASASSEVVPLDKRCIDNADMIVAYIEKPTFGTAMELCHGFESHNTINFVINPNRKFQNDIWLSFHSHIMFWSVEDCADYVISTWHKPQRILTGPRSCKCINE